MAAVANNDVIVNVDALFGEVEHSCGSGGEIFLHNAIRKFDKANDCVSRSNCYKNKNVIKTARKIITFYTYMFECNCWNGC